MCILKICRIKIYLFEEHACYVRNASSYMLTAIGNLLHPSIV
jgi:hypothetical protein